MKFRRTFVTAVASLLVISVFLPLVSMSDVINRGTRNPEPVPVSKILIFEKAGSIANKVSVCIDNKGCSEHIRDALVMNGYYPTIAETNRIDVFNSSYSDLTNYNAIFIVMGAYEYDGTLAAAEQDCIIYYLEKGGKLYIEGGDIGYRYSTSTFYGYFNTDYINDGGVINTAITGYAGTMMEGMVFNYQSNKSAARGINRCIDCIGAKAGATNISSAGDAAAGIYPRGTNYTSSKGYKTVYFSILFAALYDGEDPSNKYTLMRKICEYFGLMPNKPDLKPIKIFFDKTKINAGDTVNITAFVTNTNVSYNNLTVKEAYTLDSSGGFYVDGCYIVSQAYNCTSNFSVGAIGIRAHSLNVTPSSTPFNLTLHPNHDNGTPDDYTDDKPNLTVNLGEPIGNNEYRFQTGSIANSAIHIFYFAKPINFIANNRYWITAKGRGMTNSEYVWTLNNTNLFPGGWAQSWAVVDKYPAQYLDRDMNFILYYYNYNYTNVRFYEGNPADEGKLIEEKNISRLGLNEVQNVTITYTVPSSSKDIYVVVDKDNLIPEGDEDNNQIYSTLEVRNLLYTDIVFGKKQYVKDDKCSITVNVKDQNGDAVTDATVIGNVTDPLGSLTDLTFAHTGSGNYENNTYKLLDVGVYTVKVKATKTDYEPSSNEELISVPKLPIYVDFVSGTAYQTGEIIKTAVLVLDANGHPVSGATVKCNYSYPDGSMWKENQLMIEFNATLAKGVYVNTTIAPSREGVYLVYVNATYDSSFAVASRGFQISKWANQIGEINSTLYAFWEDFNATWNDWLNTFSTFWDDYNATELKYFNKIIENITSARENLAKQINDFWADYNETSDIHNTTVHNKLNEINTKITNFWDNVTSSFQYTNDLINTSRTNLSSQIKGFNDSVQQDFIDLQSFVSNDNNKTRTLVSKFWDDFNETWAWWNDYYNTTLSGHNATMVSLFAEMSSNMSSFYNTLKAMLSDQNVNISAVDAYIKDFNASMQARFNAMLGNATVNETRDLVKYFWQRYNETYTVIRIYVDREVFTSPVTLYTESPSKKVAPGREVTYVLIITNNDNVPRTLDLNVGYVPAGWVVGFDVYRVTIPPHSQQEIKVIIKAPGREETVKISVWGVDDAGKPTNTIVLTAISEVPLFELTLVNSITAPIILLVLIGMMATIIYYRRKYK